MGQPTWLTGDKLFCPRHVMGSTTMDSPPEDSSSGPLELDPPPPPSWAALSKTRAIVIRLTQQSVRFANHQKP